VFVELLSDSIYFSSETSIVAPSTAGWVSASSLRFFFSSFLAFLSISLRRFSNENLFCVIPQYTLISYVEQRRFSLLLDAKIAPSSFLKLELMKTKLLLMICLLCAGDFTVASGNKSDADIKSKLLGYWQGGRHDYLLKDDGIMYMCLA
jgi:hypothetical protein